MLHFVTSYMKQNKSRKQTLESAQYGLEISFKRTSITLQGKYLSSNFHFCSLQSTEVLTVNSCFQCLFHALCGNSLILHQTQGINFLVSHARYKIYCDFLVDCITTSLDWSLINPSFRNLSLILI